MPQTLFKIGDKARIDTPMINMKISMHLSPQDSGVSLRFTNLAHLRDFLSNLTTAEDSDGPLTVSMSADLAYMLVAFAARGEMLPRTAEERRAHAEHTGGNHV